MDQVKGFSNASAWYLHEPRGEEMGFNKTYIIFISYQDLYIADLETKTLLCLDGEETSDPLRS